MVVKSRLFFHGLCLVFLLAGLENGRASAAHLMDANPFLEIGVSLDQRIRAQHISVVEQARTQVAFELDQAVYFGLGAVNPVPVFHVRRHRDYFLRERFWLPPAGTTEPIQPVPRTYADLRQGAPVMTVESLRRFFVRRPWVPLPSAQFSDLVAIEVIAWDSNTWIAGQWKPEVHWDEALSVYWLKFDPKPEGTISLKLTYQKGPRYSSYQTPPAPPPLDERRTRRILDLWEKSGFASLAEAWRRFSPNQIAFASAQTLSEFLRQHTAYATEPLVELSAPLTGDISPFTRFLNSEGQLLVQSPVAAAFLKLSLEFAYAEDPDVSFAVQPAVPAQAFVLFFPLHQVVRWSVRGRPGGFLDPTPEPVTPLEASIRKHSLAQFTNASARDCEALARGQTEP